MPRIDRDAVRRAAYLLVLALIGGFLWRLGAEPWKIAAGSWKVMLAVIMVAPFSLAVQVRTFVICAPGGAVLPSFRRMLRIWAAASVTSLVAPIFAGLAVRAGMLKREGMTLEAIGIATLRQTWHNTRIAWLTAAGLILLGASPFDRQWGIVLVAGWLGLLLLRGLPRRFAAEAWFGRYLGGAQLRPLAPSEHAWMLGQLTVMAVNYFLAYTMAGASPSPGDSLLLAALTVLGSLLVVIPNGLGILDALWVWMATRMDLSLAEGVALALTMRLSFLCGAALVFAYCELAGRGAR